MSASTCLALGDSYTIGEAVPEAGRWPVQLAAKLGWSLPTIVAQTGWTTDELSLAIDAAVLAPRYEHVSLLIGVNNQYRGRTVANYAAEFRVLLDRAIGFAGGDAARVFAVSIPDWGVTAFAAIFIRSFAGWSINVGPLKLGLIHLFILLTFHGIWRTLGAIRQGDLAAHQASMRGMYFGALIIAGLLAFAPGRIMYRMFFA